MKTGVWEGKAISLVLRDSVLGTGPKASKEGRVMVTELQVSSGPHQCGWQEDLKLSDSHSSGILSNTVGN